MLPGAYERWYVELTGRASPVESRSTCASCAMLPGAPDLPPEGPFAPEVRCCTYHPRLPAHLVGGILAAGTDEGRARVRARIATRAGVTPLGIAPGPEHVAMAPGAFGRDLALRCPFHDDGRCSIWAHRGVACAAFHCKLDRGAIGAWWWSLITVAFDAVDRALARWLLERLGLDRAACDEVLRRPDDEALARRAWGAYDGREEAYFVEAAALVEPLGWADVAAIGGRDLTMLAEAMRGALARMDALPARARRSGEVLVHIRDRSVRVQHPAAPLDLLELPRTVVDALPAADTPLAELGLPDDVVRKLLDWRVIIGE
jgi:hypothetical protein